MSAHEETLTWELQMIFWVLSVANISFQSGTQYNPLQQDESFRDWLIGVKRRFQHFFNYFTAAKLPTRVFLGFLTPILQTLLFPSNWLRFDIGYYSIGERQKTLVTVSFVKLRKEYWPSWGSYWQPVDSKPASLQTELPGLGIISGDTLK